MIINNHMNRFVNTNPTNLRNDSGAEANESSESYR